MTDEVISVIGIGKLGEQTLREIRKKYLPQQALKITIGAFYCYLCVV